MKRRKFLRQSAVVSLGFLGLYRCTVEGNNGGNTNELFRYGPLERDPEGYLNLPKGFSYKIISKTGDMMDDGLMVPGYPDGMATFAAEDGKVILVRNHELSPNQLNQSAFGKDNSLVSQLSKDNFYDFGGGKTPGLGGVSTLVYDETSGTVTTQFLSLAGTYRNCAGGPTPWGSWITCEEDVTKKRAGTEQDHGYNFEIPAVTNPTMVPPIPLRDMGRFNHEAVCVHPASGIVYQTEDRSDGLIYRFLPNVKSRLHQGGKLQVLAVKGAKSLDTRNWVTRALEVGKPVEVEWLHIDEVDSPKDDLRIRGFQNGAAVFARGEGMWYGDDELFFACTNGGASKYGQVFKYIPSSKEGTPDEKDEPGQLVLFAESNDINILKNCDNLTISPWGDVILCEDNKNAFMRGITPEGKIYTFGHNVGSTSEFAGATFSPSGKTLFVNIQANGHTLAITGPWDQMGELS